MKKKIIIIDDSALMRRVFCDIINSDDRFEVVNMATDGVEGFKYLCEHTYDAVVLDVYMPRMTGIQMLEEMRKSNVRAKVLMSSTTTAEGAKETMDALALGAIDFIKKPENVANARDEEFRSRFLELLYAVSCAPLPKNITAPATASRASGPTFAKRFDVNFHTNAEKLASDRAKAAQGTFENTRPVQRAATATSSTSGTAPAARSVSSEPIRMRGNKIVAIASSTGGPRALHDVIPFLPGNLPVPVLLVQHMPAGFTASFAARLDEISAIKVSEAKAGDVLEAGHVYIAPGGKHMKVEKRGASHVISLTDEPTREGVKPCANYMYESLIDSGFDEIVCAVMTGMGADGTAGIVNLEKKKRICVIAQDEATCTVYGMPKCIAQTGLVNDVVPLAQIASQITKNLGVR